jgi:hypothetical protein
MFSANTRLYASDPFRRTAAITPSDIADNVSGSTVGLLVTAAGNVAFIPKDNADAASIPMLAVAVNTIIHVVARRVLATGTTATVVAIY